MGFTRAIIEAQEYVSSLGREDYADYFREFGRKLAPVIREGLVKPRLRKSGTTRWVCMCDEAIALDGTPEDAYATWKPMLSNRGNAVAY